MLDHILVPLDGSIQSESILPHLRRLAQLGAREITLLRADLPVAVDAYSLLCEAAQNRAREYLRCVRTRLADLRIHCQILSRIGPPARTILEVAQEQGATVILMSTQPRGAIARWLFGSISEHVLQASPIPVIIVPPMWSYDLAPADPSGLRPVQRILVPVDGSELGVPALLGAVGLAQKFQARIHLLHVRPSRYPAGTPGGVDDPGEEDSADATAEKMREAWLRCAAAGVETHQRVESGEVVPQILKVARDGGMDWIAMATHPRRGLARWLTGSITEHVLREVGIPMLVVPMTSGPRSRPSLMHHLSTRT
ncbi:MAG TPA: universal stress protein [Planctomycetota bacterium]|nr:universal stress protein [Planctomycetota bacterium]